MKFRVTRKDGPPTTEDRCAHILSMIDDIEKVLANRAAPPTVHIWAIALERMFEVIGVAASHIPDEVKRSAPDVDWELIASLDEQLAKPSVRIDEDVLLDAAARLGPLKSFASKMIA